VFKLQTVHADGRRVAIVRLADQDEPPYSLTQEAKYLARMWETRIDRRHNPAEFGMLYHFARECPAGKAKEIFKLVLKEWGTFMEIVKTSPEFAHEDSPRHYRHPRLSIHPAFRPPCRRPVGPDPAGAGEERRHHPLQRPAQQGLNVSPARVSVSVSVSFLHLLNDSLSPPSIPGRQAKETDDGGDALPLRYAYGRANIRDHMDSRERHEGIARRN
jgi:hypothetical protein